MNPSWTSKICNLALDLARDDDPERIIQSTLAEISRILGEIVGISLERASAFSEAPRDPHMSGLTRLMACQRALSAANLHAQEEVRRQLAEDLHDTTNEIASAISMGLKSLSMMLEGQTTPEQDACMERLQGLSQMLVREQRALLDDLDPLVLRTHGIGIALRARARRDSDAARLELLFSEGGVPKRLIHDVELAVYRIACEAIANVVEHAEARTMEVAIDWNDASLVVEVRDDGCGFDASSDDILAVEDLDDTLFGFHRGLGNMRNRAYAAGISLDITSELGRGTCVRMEVPLTWQVLTQA